MFINSTGMVSSVGLTAASACAANRAGISGLKDLAVEYRGAPIVGAIVPGLDAITRPGPRLVELLRLSLMDLLRHHPARSWADVPLLVGLAEPGRPGGGAFLADSIVSLAQEALEIRFHPELSKPFATGHTAGFEALGTARSLIRGDCRPVLWPVSTPW